MASPRPSSPSTEEILDGMFTTEDKDFLKHDQEIVAKAKSLADEALMKIFSGEVKDAHDLDPIQEQIKKVEAERDAYHAEHKPTFDKEEKVENAVKEAGEKLNSVLISKLSSLFGADVKVSMKNGGLAVMVPKGVDASKVDDKAAQEIVDAAGKEAEEVLRAGLRR